MAIKVFVRPVTACSYQGDPATQFSISVDFLVAQSTGLMVNGNNVEFAFDLEASPGGVYQQVFDYIVSFCAENSMETPVKADIYGYLPIDFATLLPE